MDAIGCFDVRLILFLSISALFLLFCHFTMNSPSPFPFLQQNNNSTENGQILGFWNSAHFEVTTKREERELFPEGARFILPTFPNGQCGGLGNQMFRFASLYGIGRPLNRVPAFAKYQHCEGVEDHGYGKEMFNESGLPFPLYKKHLKFVVSPFPPPPNPFNPFCHLLSDTPSNQTALAPNFGLGCCKFDDPISLAADFGPKSSILYLQTLTNYLQSFKYFHQFRHQIRQIFQCSAQLVQRARQIHAQLFGADQGQHRFCVHTRRGDFGALWFESKKEFTEKAVQFLHQKLQQIRPNSVSFVFFGKDSKFLKSLQLGPIRRHFVEGFSRNEELCLAIHSCHSLLLTASASTFGWWIGYLMGGNGSRQIFYNFDLNFTQYTRQNFPEDWTPIWLEGGKIMTEKLEKNRRKSPIRVFPSKKGLI